MVTGDERESAVVVRTGMRAAFVWSLLACLVSSVACWIGWGGQAHATSQGQDIKAAFLYNFAKFIEWPETALPTAADTFTICVWGETELAEAANRVLRDKQVQGRTVVARALRAPEEARACHVLFLNRLEEPLAASAWNMAKTLPILTVGETDRFLVAGGIIKLLVEDGKLRFEISPQAAARAQLKISSKLLKLGRIVDTP